LKIVKFKQKLFYELYKIGNLYVLKNNKENAKPFGDIPPVLENLLPEGINRELCEIKNKASIHNKYELLFCLNDAFGRMSAKFRKKRD
jgi:hypothetical protein